MFCPICGSKLDPTQKFCIECGSKISLENSAGESSGGLEYQSPGAAGQEQNFGYQSGNDVQSSVQENNQPTQSGNSPMNSYQPTQSGNSPMNSYQPTQQGNSPMGSYQPSQQGNSPMGSYQPSQQGNSTMGSYQPSQSGNPPMNSYQPTQQSNSPMGNYQPQQQFAASQTGGFQYQQPSAYSGTMPITNGVPGAAAVKTKKPASPKKFIIITLCILLVAAIGILAFILIRKKMDHDYIVNNPTKAALASYKAYLDENDSDDPIYSLFKNADKQGTLSVNATGKMTANGTSSDIDVKAIYGYDKVSGRYYLKVDGGQLLSQYTAGQGNDSSTFVEMNMDPDKLFMNYNIAGKNGKYYIDNKNFRQDINDSIFSFDKDNILHFTDKQAFNNFINSYEASVKQLKQDGTEDSDTKEFIDNITKIIEKNGKSEVKDGTAKISNGRETKEVPADVITYTFNKTSMKTTLSEIKKEVSSYIVKVVKDSKQAQESKESLEKMFDQMTDEFDKNASDDVKMTVVIYLDKDNHSVIKNEVDINNFEKDGGSVHFYVDFLKDPDNMIRAEFVSKDSEGKENKMFVQLVKNDNGKVVKYDLTLNVTSPQSQYDMYGVQSNDNEVTEKKMTASFEYNRDTKKFKVSAGSSDDGFNVSYSGDAVFTDNSMSLKLDNIVNNDDVKLSLNIDFKSSAPSKTDTSGAKNLLKLSSEEFSQLFGGGVLTPPVDYDDYDYDDYDDYDYDDYDLSGYDASVVESFLKTYYSGVKSGVITKSEAPQISVLPEKNASASERNSAADSSTVGDALKYFEADYLEDELGNLCVTEDGGIISKQDTTGKKIKLQSISVNTKLGEIFGSAV